MPEINVFPAPYLNDPQVAVQLSHSPHKVFIGGRGVGKTTIIAEDIIRYFVAMPRGKISLNGLTYFHIRTKSLPPIIDHFERRGLYRGIHYFVGHRAPKRNEWPEPYAPPLDYSNCIHFYNGFVVEFNSFDRPEMARSGSYDGMIFDECTKLKKSAIESDVLPANRGNRDRFGHLRFHHGTLFLGTMPLTPDGDWVFEYQELAKEMPSRYCYLEASAVQNTKILGEMYFRDLKRVLPKIVYDLEVLNIRRKQNTNGFYPLLKAPLHGYTDSYEYNYIDQTSLPAAGSVFDCRADRDCIASEPLYVSFDFGTSQNCMIVAQWDRLLNEIRIIRNFYVENEMLSVLVQEFIDHYKCKPVLYVYLYGGSDGNRKNDAASRNSYFDDVREQLAKAGWEVQLRAELYEAHHMDKFQFWFKFLSGEQPGLPAFRINMNNAMETFFSMDNAPILPQEFKKDKSSERRKDQPRWKATDLSDAADNLFYWLLSPLVGEQYPTNEMILFSGR
jgi:hypothetical protein